MIHYLNLIFVVKCVFIHVWAHETHKVTRSIDEIVYDYEDEKNAMIAVTEKEKDIGMLKELEKPLTETNPKDTFLYDRSDMYEDFYEETANRIQLDQSMNMIYFGPPNSFLRIDPETILHLLVNTKKNLIPITRAILAWDILTDGKTAAFLQGRELLAFGTLLNVVPEEDLYYINFGDPSVLKYFSTFSLNLHARKYGVLAAAYRRYFGNHWYRNSSQISELGYLLCGFPSSDLNKIKPQTFKEINVEVLNKLERCTGNQTETLYKIATHPEAYGEPHKWSSHEIGRMKALFICIPKEDISCIKLEAISAISPQVMKKINQKKLEYFTKEQILRMGPKTRRIYILRVQLRDSLDMSQIIARKLGFRSSPILCCVFSGAMVALLFNREYRD